MSIGFGFYVPYGVRQKDVLSPFLFAVYIDSIIVQMRNSSLGIRISSTFTGCLLYADDVVLISFASSHGRGAMSGYWSKWWCSKASGGSL